MHWNITFQSTASNFQGALLRCNKGPHSPLPFPLYLLASTAPSKRQRRRALSWRPLFRAEFGSEYSQGLPIAFPAPVRTVLIEDSTFHPSAHAAQCCYWLLQASSTKCFVYFDTCNLVRSSVSCFVISCYHLQRNGTVFGMSMHCASTENSTDLLEGPGHCLHTLSCLGAHRCDIQKQQAPRRDLCWKALT